MRAGMTRPFECMIQLTTLPQKSARQGLRRTVLRRPWPNTYPPRRSTYMNAQGLVWEVDDGSEAGQEEDGVHFQVRIKAGRDPPG